MDLFLTVVFLSALLFFLGMCFGRALLPIHGAWIVLQGKEQGEDLEQKLYALLWLQGLGFIRCPICILDQGLNETGLTLVEHLLRRWPEITLWSDWGTAK